MVSNSLFIIGALIVVALIVAAFVRADKAKKSSASPEPHVTQPPIQAPHIPPATDDWGFKPGEPETLPELAVTTAVEVWNQTGFQVFVTQQGIRVTVGPRGRALMSNGIALTVAPASADDTLQSVSLEESSTETSTVYTLIVQ